MNTCTYKDKAFHVGTQPHTDLDVTTLKKKAITLDALELLRELHKSRLHGVAILRPCMHAHQ